MRRRGANAIEFALTLPIFLLGLFAAVQSGLYFFWWAMASEAVRRGCSEGVEVSEVLADPETKAEQAMDRWLSHGGLTCTQMTCSAELTGTAPNRQLSCMVSGSALVEGPLSLGVWNFEVEHARRMVRQ
ncbi:MAG: TadE family protein [Myxococcota bacterium]